MQDPNQKPLDTPSTEDGSIPAFLRREEVTSNSEKEVPAMIAKTDDEATDAQNDEGPAPAKPAKTPKAKTPRKAAAKANGKGNGKAAVKAQGKKAAPAATPKAAKGKGKKAERQCDPAKLDAFGSRKESIKSKAAAMYAKGKGATLGEVKEALGSVQFNLLTELTERGHKVDKAEVKNASGRMVTRYKLHGKD
jgi:hypothetical protein